MRRLLRPAASLRLWHFKCCFSFRDPKIAVPLKKTHPLSKSMNSSNISRPCFAIVGCQAVNYLQMSKQWGSRVSMPTSSILAARRRMMVSNVNAFLTTDTPSQSTFVISLRLRNVFTKGYSPLHSRCMALFGWFVDEYHQFWFDNLYMSAKFTVGSFNHPNKVIIEGVSRTSSRGVPTQILQQEVITKESINAANVKTRDRKSVVSSR